MLSGYHTLKDADVILNRITTMQVFRGSALNNTGW
jgi:hypothetical protein